MLAQKSIPSFAAVPQPVIATRLSPYGLFMMIQDHVEPLDLKELWSTVTHIVFEGLMVDESGVSVGCATGPLKSKSITHHPEVYVKWLAELQKKYKHLQIIWALPPLASNCVSLGGWSAICHKLLDLKKKLPMDGILFDFSAETDIHCGYFGEMVNFRYDMLVWSVLPNSVHLLEKMEQRNILYSLYRHSDMLIMNSFGFFTFEPTSGRLMAVSDTKLADFQRVVEWIEDNHAIPSLDSVVIGIDTLTTQFDVQEDSLFATNMNMVPTEPTVCIYSPNRVNFADEEKKDKLLYCISKQMAGVCFGELRNERTKDLRDHPINLAGAILLKKQSAVPYRV